MSDSPDDGIYDELGVTEIVNAAGTKTRFGGSLIRPDAADAMRAAADSFVRVSDLQARASELIAEVTRADLGYVASGASACMTLAAAACVAGLDLASMAQLPDTEGLADEIVVPRTHRTGYDRAYRLAGTSIVDVGTSDSELGTGAANTEPWEIEAAIDENTAAVAYVQRPDTGPPLEDVVEAAHDNFVPVIVDAAAELPPAGNLRRFHDAGADLVVFSGGKAIRGPQSTGFLAGREDLVQSAALQHLDAHAAEAVWDPPSELFPLEEVGGVPRQGVGRGMKVGKEELVGFVRALQLFRDDDHGARQEAWLDRAQYVAKNLDDIDGITTLVRPPAGDVAATDVLVRVDEPTVRTYTRDIVAQLRDGSPPVYVGADSVDDAEFTIDPCCLSDDEVNLVIGRLRSILA